ncbi:MULTISPECIES: hypothetical protein [Roseomonadaceae]|uniref:Sulfotransferase domain-containing protein n=1 Tax=Falsiroseomonas oleicola TaxID=2801474 RepID=A0ABS6HAF9_9PROT|nr:hypothetical protein [Roseomonas oleicola]MBU8544481.1 hypothetical protein [Roseomonas oleicola]
MSKPLLIVGLPRGFTSESYRLVQQSTQLLEPPASSGEVLNWQRWAEPPAGINGMRFYDRRDENYAGICEVYKTFLFPDSKYVIKDVVQPFHTIRFLRENPGLCNVLYIRRDLMAVRHSLLKRSWKYVHSMDAIDQQFLDFDFVDSTRVMYDKSYLFSKIERMGYNVRRLNYITPEFERTRNNILDEVEQRGAPLLPPTQEISNLSPVPFFPVGKTIDLKTSTISALSDVFSMSDLQSDGSNGLRASRPRSRLSTCLPPLPTGARIGISLERTRFVDLETEFQVFFSEFTQIAKASSMAKTGNRIEILLPPSTEAAALHIFMYSDRIFVPGISTDVTSLLTSGAILGSISIEAA